MLNFKMINIARTAKTSRWLLFFYFVRSIINESARINISVLLRPPVQMKIYRGTDNRHYGCPVIIV